MSGNLTPAQMFDHELNPVKGWPSPYAVDKVAVPANPSAAAPAGSLMYLDSNGKFALGASDTSVAIFAIQGQNDFDANADVGNITGGIQSGLVALGAYELETTEYVTTDAYVPNTQLVAASGDDLGKVKANAGNTYAANVVGVVSDGALTNDHNKSVLRFWPCYLPRTGVSGA